MIVPFYNVEALPRGRAWTASSGRRSRDFEVLLVDDGSPDGSRAIAERYADRDPGCGSSPGRTVAWARPATPVSREARGRYLTFVDSDDCSPRTRCALMLGSARRPGRTSWSARSSGSTRRTAGAGVGGRTCTRDGVERHRDRGVPAAPAQPLHVEQAVPPRLLGRPGPVVPRGRRLRGPADHHPAARPGRSIDVLPDVVYRYRARDDQSSISQQTASLKDLRDRIEAWEVSREVLRAEVSPRSTRAGSRRCSPRTSTGTSPARARSTTPTGPSCGRRAEPHRGRAAWAWDHTAPAAGVLTALAQPTAGPTPRSSSAAAASSRTSGRPPSARTASCSSSPLLGDPDLDDDLFLVRPDQLRLSHAVENLHWVDQPDGGRACALSGWAYLARSTWRSTTPRSPCSLRNEATGRSGLPVTDRPKPTYFPPREDLRCDYSGGQVRGTSCRCRPRRRGRRWWSVWLQVSSAGLHRRPTGHPTDPRRRRRRGPAAPLGRAAASPPSGATTRRSGCGRPLAAPAPTSSSTAESSPDACPRPRRRRR